MAPVAVACIVVAVFALFASLYAVRVPLGQPIDEPSHLRYAHLIADNAALPSGDVPEKQQPPLFYAVAAGLIRAGVPDQAVRSVNVLVGTATIVVVMLAAAALAPRHPWRSVGAGAIVAGIPIVQGGSGAVSNDPLAWLSGAVIILLLARLARGDPPTRASALAIGATLAMALLSKETAWVLADLLLVVATWRWWGRWNLRLVTLVVGPPLVFAGWWFARNIALFHWPTPPLSPLTTMNQYLRHTGQLRGFISETVRSISGPETTTGLVTRGTVASALTWLLAFTLSALCLAACGRILQRWASLSPTQRRLVMVGAAAFLLPSIAFVANSVLIDLQPQVRYLAVAATIPAAASAWTVDWLTRAGPRRVSRAPVLWPAVAIAAVLVVALDVDTLRVATSVG